MRDGRGPARGRYVLAAAGGLVVAAVAAGPGAAIEGRPLIYAPTPAANAIFDAGVTEAFRQAPIFDDPRWPASRQLAKVTGRELAGLSARQMVARLRRALADGRANGRAGVDEITPGHWTTSRAQELQRAMVALGQDARRVVFYASPAMVGQVGRRDLRQRLPELHARLLNALSRGGAAFLEVYRGSLAPLPPQEMAASLTRWRARWPSRESGRLRVLIGPAPPGMTQAQVWDRVRNTPAGRAILANGPGAFGLRSAQEGSDWAAQLGFFRAAPDQPPPGGDVAVARAGLLRVSVKRNQLMRRNQAFRITTPRAGNGNVRLVPIPRGQRRVFGRFATPEGGGTVLRRLPKVIRPGRYHLVVYFRGGGIVDRVITPIRVRRP